MSPCCADISPTSTNCPIKAIEPVALKILFPSFLVLIKQELQGFEGKLYGSWKQPGKKINYFS